MTPSFAAIGLHNRAQIFRGLAGVSLDHTEISNIDGSEGILSIVVTTFMTCVSMQLSKI